ncbi:MAG: hypothetical protein ACP5NZ_04210 [Nanobdellota archaeon]
MNFKPTLWKSIVSLAGVVLTDLLLAKSSVNQIECMDIACKELFKGELVNINIIISSLIVGLIIYTIWSLFQKRKN